MARRNWIFILLIISRFLYGGVQFCGNIFGKTLRCLTTLVPTLRCHLTAWTEYVLMQYLYIMQVLGCFISLQVYI